MIKHLLIVEFDLSKGGLVYGRIFATRSFTSVFRFLNSNLMLREISGKGWKPR